MQWPPTGGRIEQRVRDNTECRSLSTLGEAEVAQLCQTQVWVRERPRLGVPLALLEEAEALAEVRPIPSRYDSDRGST